MPPSSNLLHAGFKCRRSKLCLLSGPPGRVANAELFGSAWSSLEPLEQGDGFAPNGMRRALRSVLGVSKCPSYTVSITRSVPAVKSIAFQRSARSSPIRKPVKTNNRAMDQTRWLGKLFCQ